MCNTKGVDVKKILLNAGILVVVGFVAIQFFRPERTNPAVDPAVGSLQQLHADPEVEKNLRAACFDCHSHETIWPWYSSVAPVSWLLARDVSGGRKHLNFSIWGKYSPDRKLLALSDIVEQVSTDEMPLKPYRLLHSGARLDSSARKAIVQWALREKTRLSSEP
jgi:Haem-binding domain